MVTLGPTKKSRSVSAGADSSRPDDLSDDAHRQLIGYIGLSLPIVLYVVAGVRNATSSGRWHLLDSISAYYYTGAVAAFVGLLVALALFLFSYRGYENKHHRFDRLIAVTAGCAALGVAFFPTKAPDNIPTPPFWEPTTGWFHYASAIILFGSFAAFCLWLFRLKAPGEHVSHGKRVRNRLYLACGMAICGGMVCTAINGARHEPIFVPESICVMAFAVSWLAKGYAVRTIRVEARKVLARSGLKAVHKEGTRHRMDGASP